MQEIQIIYGNQTETLTLDFVAKQASSSVLYQKGKAVILSTLAISPLEVEENFTPFSVQYIEKAYSAGKFPHGFIKREGKLTEFEILTSRLVDRSLRPFFPKNYRHPTHLTLLVLSYDREVDLQVCALNAASSTLFLSEIPIKEGICAVRVGESKGEFILNPSQEDLEKSSLDLFISGTKQDITMIEMRGNAQNGFDEKSLMKAIEFAGENIQNYVNLYTQKLQDHKKPALQTSDHPDDLDKEVYAIFQENYKLKLELLLKEMSKSESNAAFRKFCKYILDNHQNYEEKVLMKNLEIFKANLVREQILKNNIRMDDRGLKDVRPIEIQTNILPSVHGSALFTRGKTQALVVSTLGSQNDAQSRESLGLGSSKEYFSFHYNFPGFSVGEPTPIGPPSRRELGHGNLAKKALQDSIVDKNVTIRLVSEILESNGSSSMASVCGGSLALSAAGIETNGLVAGVAMGLVKEGLEYKILTDIIALEDYHGDMDFKIAGNLEFITAMQMDLKIHGISFSILKEILKDAKEARMHILKKMQEAQESITINQDVLPKTLEFNVPPNKIVEIIGAGGKVIKEIIERFEVNIDLDRKKGGVKIFATRIDSAKSAQEYILNLIKEKPNYQVGEIVEGKIKKIVDFGVFVALQGGIDALLHIKNLTSKGLSLSDFQEGQEIDCKIISLHKGKVDVDLYE